MTDRLEKAVRVGKHAAMLVNDPVLNDAIDRMEAEATKALIAAPADQMLERRADVLAAQRLKEVLRAYVVNGQVAARSLTPNKE